MPHTTRNPLREIRIVGRWEKAPVRLLARYALLFPLLLLLRWVVIIAAIIIVTVLAPLRLRLRLLLLSCLHLPAMIRLPLLAIIHQERQRGRQTDDDEALEDVVLDLVVVAGVVVATGDAFGDGVVVVVVAGVVVVGVGFVEEVGDPFAQGPFCFWFWGRVRVRSETCEEGLFLRSGLTWLGLYRLDFTICDCVPETSHPELCQT